jgi:4-amino-4-deoxy-L-arabinose transferase-like glycosyltransferase
MTEAPSPRAAAARRSLLAMMLVGVAIRLTVIASARSSGLFADMQEYFDRAMHLYQNGALPPDMFRMPLSALLFAACTAAHPADPLLMIRLAQVAASAIMIAAAFHLGWRISGRTGALYASGVVAAYPSLVLYSVYIMPETLYTTLLICSVACAGATATVWRAVAAGVLGGAANLTRSAGLMLLPIVPAIVGWSAWRDRRHAARALALGLTAAAAFAAVVSPWIVRNWQRFGDARWTDTSGGVVFLMANNPIATGRPEMVHWDFAMKQLEGVGTEGRRSAEGYRLGLRYLRERPLWAAELTLKKARHMLALDGREHAWVYSVGYFGARSTATVVLWGVAILIAFPVVAGIALAGLRRADFAQPAVAASALVCLSAFAMHLLTYGDARYHLPLVPLLAVLGATAFRAGGGDSRRRDVIAAAVGVCLIGIWIADLRELLPKLMIVASEGGASAAFPY